MRFNHSDHEKQHSFQVFHIVSDALETPGDSDENPATESGGCLNILLPLGENHEFITTSVLDDISQDEYSKPSSCSVFINNGCSLEHLGQFQHWLGNYSYLRDIQIYIAAISYTEPVKAVCAGLRATQSTTTVDITLALPLPIVATTGVLEKEAFHELQELVANSGNLQHLHYSICNIFPFSTFSIIQPNLDAFEGQLFDAVANTRLRTFGYFAREGYISPTNKIKAWNAMKNNPSLRHLKVKRHLNIYHHLVFLAADKNYNWSDRWNSSTECGTILQEALDCDLNFDKVSVLYHFLSASPNMIARALLAPLIEEGA